MAAIVKPSINLFEDYQLMFAPDFGGERSKYGTRIFNLRLDDPAVIQELQSSTPPCDVREYTTQDGDVLYFLPVYLNFDSNKGAPPQVYEVTSKQRVLLNANTVSVLDHADISSVDVTVNYWPSKHNDGNEYLKVYAKNVHVKINEDPLELKYADIPVAGQVPDISEDHQTPNEDDLPF